MENQTLIQIIADRMETAMKDYKHSFEQASEAMLTAYDRANELRAVREANPYDVTARLAHVLAMREYLALEELVAATDRAARVIENTLATNAENFGAIRITASNLAKAVEAAEAA